MKISKHFKIISFSIGAVWILILTIFGWQYFFSQPVISGKFQLTASITDDAGIDPGTDFILKSSQDLKVRTVERIFTFSPEIDFKVKKINSGSLSSKILGRAFAQEGPDDYANTFQITPQKPLEPDTIYRAVISDEFVEREYSWAYQVKAPFQVISTHPRDKGTYVPLNSGIEVTFNREELFKPEEYFSIEPATKGIFSVEGNKLIFLPNQLEPATVYKVVIQQGLGVEGSNDILEKDYSFYFETDSGSYAGASFYFDLRDDFLEFIPNEKPIVGFSSYNIDVNEVEFRLYQFSGIDEFLNSYQESRKWSLGWTAYYRKQAGNFYQPKSETKIISFRAEPIRADYEQFIEIPQTLEAGYYLLDAEFDEISSGKNHRQAWLQINSLAHYSSLTNNQGLLWINDFSKKAAVANIQVSYRTEAEKIVLGETDQEGFVQFTTPEGLRSQAQQEVIKPQYLYLEHSEYPAKIVKITDSWQYTYGVDEEAFYWSHLSSDRYTYQMNDVLKYWGVIKGRSEDLKQKKVKVGIYQQGYWGYQGDEADEPLVAQEAVISSFDTVQGQLSFQGLTPGSYDLRTSLDGKVVSQSSIEVLTYTKPAYQITVTPSSNSVFAGEEINFEIEASFFDGTPVSNLQLQYNGYWKGSITGELTLDELGQGVFPYIPLYTESTYDYWPRSLRIEFSPKMSEEGEIYGESRVLVFGPNLFLQSFQRAEADDSYELTTKLNQVVLGNLQSNSGISREEYIGLSVKDHSLSVNIVKIVYHKEETGQYYDYLNKVVRKKYDYWQEEQIIESKEGKTDSKGELSFRYHFPKEEDVSYRVDFTTHDSQGRRVKSSTYIWDFSSGYNNEGSFGLFLDINNNSGQEEFSLGDKVELELQIFGEEEPVSSQVLFYRYQNGIDEAKIVSSLSYEEVFEESFVPSVQYRAVVLSPYGFEESNSVMASFQEEDKKLSINIEPDKEKYRPGEEINLALEVRDKNSLGVISEVNVAVVDEALFHILPYEYSRDILTDLYQNIWTYPLTDASRYTFMNSEGAEKGGCFAQGTIILTADGSSKKIEDIKMGDQVLTWADGQFQELATAVVQGVSQHWVKEYLVINDSLRVTPEHLLNVDGQWIYAGGIKMGQELMSPEGQPIIVSKIERRQNFIPVYNIVVSQYHTYFADGFYVHNEEKGGTPRVNFVDVAFYDTVRTDENGKSSVSFISPDNITAWRVTAQVFDPERIQTGQEAKLVKTSLPFFVDVSLSNFYLVGDKPIIRVRTSGSELKTGEEESFRIQCEALNLEKISYSSSNITYFPLGVLPKGEYELTIFGQQGKNEDAIARKIKVVESYFRTGESSFYRLSSDLSGLQGNETGFTRIKFMDWGRGRLYRALWQNKYHSGLRVDQLVAKYLAGEYLVDYFDESGLENSLDLSSYHLENGGLGLLPYSSDDLSLTAKLADLVPEFIFQGKVKDYLLTSLADGKADIHRTSQALYGLASLDELVLSKINLVKENSALDLEDKIYLALGLAKLGDKEGARKIYGDEIKSQLRFQGQEAWLYKESDNTRQVKLTGLVAVLASYLNEEDARALGEYIFHHNPEKDLDSLEELLYLKSELAKPGADEAEFGYQTGNRSDLVTIEKGGSYEITLSNSELSSLKFSDVKGDIALVSFYEKEENPENLKKNLELSLTRSYLVDGQATHSFKEGDIVLVRLDPKIDQSAIDGRYQVVDYLPSGLRPMTLIYHPGFSFGTTCDPIYPPSLIENNIVYFNIWEGFNINSYCINRTLNYYARVVSPGEYKANPALIQSLKDMESLNISSVDVLEIK